MDGVSQAPLTEDWGLKKIDNWELKFCWAPVRCFLTDKSMWGKRAYHGIHNTGVNLSHYWIDKDAFILWRLTQ